MSSELIIDKDQIPWYRKPLAFFLILLICQPVTLIILLTGPNYLPNKGGYIRMPKALKYFFIAGSTFFTLMWLARLFA